MAKIEVVRESDAPLEPLRDKTVAVLGFGAQGHAHALNLRDSGIGVIVANRRDTPNGRRAIESGFEPVSIVDAVRAADLIILGLPDEAQPDIYGDQIAPHLRPGVAIGFIHGFNIRFGTITPPADVDVLMVSPKGPGYQLRTEFEAARGLAAFLAIHQDFTGQARQIGLAWARGIGCARGGIYETTFAHETEADLFGEQAVLCGGVPALIKAGFETLVEAGYPPEVAYFECVHEVKLIVDLIYKGGIGFMLDQISNTAEYGALTRGPRLITGQTRNEMRKILSEITTGQFAREWREEFQGGMKQFRELEQVEKSHPIAATRASMGIRTET